MTHKLDALFAGFASKPVAKNALMAIEAPDHGISWRGVPSHLSVDTPFCAASCTKMMTATLALQLADASEIDLDAPAASYLPKGRMDGLLRIGGEDLSGRITVRQLLSNTSGLPDYFTDRPKGGRSYMDDLQAGNDRTWTSDDALERTRELKPRFAPGTPGKAHYSDTNFVLMGQVLDALTGKPFADLIDERIVRRLGLSASYILGPERLESYAGIAPVSYGEKELHIPLSLASVGAQGGWITTLADSMTFLRAFMGGELFDKRHLGAILSNWNRVFFPFRYGMGAMKFEMHPILTGFRRIPPFFGHSGSTGALMYHCPERNFWICGTSNQFSASNLPYQFMIQAMMSLR